MDIKRYDVGGGYGYGYCDEEEQGDWVLFDDHYAVVASLQAELTKACELLRGVCKDDWSGAKTSHIEAYLARQPAMCERSEAWTLESCDKKNE